MPDFYFKCKYCGAVRRQNVSRGYGNLVSHLKDKHPGYEADYLAQASSMTGNLHSYGFVSDKVANVYHWLEWVVDRNMPLSEVDHPLTRSMSRLKPISSKTLRKYLAATTKAVEKAIASVMPPDFGVMFHGWTCFGEHYVAVIAVFWLNGEVHYVVLAVAPLDEADQTAESYCAFTRNILGSFGLSVEALKFLCGDNCATNQRTATLLGVPLRADGGAAHPKNRAELRRHTGLAPLRANATRWSSTFTMLERYVLIRDEIKRVDAMYDLVPKSAAHRRIVALTETLKTFNSVCKKLQEDTLSMSAVRVLFDKMAEMFPITSSYLSPDASIIHSPVFERAVVKIAGKCEAELTPEELDAVAPFELSSAANVPAASTQQRARTRTQARSGPEDFATALLRSDDVPAEAGPRYSPLVRAIPPTSNRCERLFSQCKLVMTPQRSSLLPINFEMIEFLRANRKYWDAHTLMGIEVADADD
ncbi:hypothetical protein PHYSODRAFT_335595 [Phytophthora sojae]|uniref:BED-type domain-containing protein n=1 Tax=Phytophthora sojae (strain P6497) TaxID=1094619 RepID=G4ZQT7_PHYSP|nr:hypothetical protein PHYSODRAFT_335595 [Phytophthora sojae]EGZ13885.1 hypothetical protein PHYSODRAFT_335595 [Phytophthora sojae]|eukprot:XP_009531314.1 hypothetical protein PHYSODRAFT_335595 [Phytophthora sojae]